MITKDFSALFGLSSKSLRKFGESAESLQPAELLGSRPVSGVVPCVFILFIKEKIIKEGNAGDLLTAKGGRSGTAESPSVSWKTFAIIRDNWRSLFLHGNLLEAIV